MRHLLIRMIVAMHVNIAALGVTAYYTLLAQAEYYNPDRPGEKPGIHIGQGAGLVGLQGTVSQEEYTDLMQGVNPVNKEPLRKTAGKQTTDAAWDLVVSAPKSWSLLWALTDDPEVRAKLERAFHFTVEELVRRIEESTFSRVGRQGRPVPAKPIILCYHHHTSRGGDPQLHDHLVICNAAVRLDGSTGAILSRPFYVRRVAFAALACCDATWALSQEFPGIELRKTKTAFEIEGISQPVLRAFSKRRIAMEAILPDLRNQTAVAKAVACLKTRDPKQLVPPLTELQTQWKEEARRLGFDQTALAHLPQQGQTRQYDKSEVLDQSFRTALGRLTERHSHFGELELVRYTADATTGQGVTGREVVDYVARELRDSPEIEYLGKLRGRARYSTPEVLKQECDLLETAEKMAAGTSHGISFTKLAVRVSLETAAATRHWLTRKTDPTLSAEQREAIEFVASHSGRLAVLAAIPGSRKNETLARLGELYKAAGYDVVAAAPGGRATARLADQTGLPAITLTTLLTFADRDQSPTAAVKHAAKQLVREAAGRYIGLYPYTRRPLLGHNSVVIVDDSQQISTQEMGKLLGHIDRAGAKLLLSGSPHGLQAIERGIPFASFVNRLPGARLTEIDCPHDRQDAQNIDHIARGDARVVLDDLARRGRLTLSVSRDAAIEKLLADWKAAGGIDAPQGHLIVVASPEEARRVNHRASAVRRAAGKTFQGGTNDESLILTSGEKIYLGDRILCTRNSSRYGVQSGTLATLTGISRRLNTIQIELDEGERVTLPLATYPNVTRGYAQTVWHAAPAKYSYLLLGGPYEDRQASVVKLSRASESTRVYVDQDNAGPELEEICRQLAQDRSKSLAMEVRQSTIPNQER